MSAVEWVTIIAASSSALTSILAAWRSNSAHDVGERNSRAISDVAKAVNGGLEQKLEPVVKRATVQAITETVIARDEQPGDEPPRDQFTA